MKVNVILPDLGKSGGVRVILSYAEYLANNGHDVCCYYPLSGAYYGWRKYLYPLRNMLRLMLSDSAREKLTASPVIVGFPYRTDERKNCGFAIEVLRALQAKRNVKIIAYGFRKPDYFPESWEFLANPSRKELCDFYDRANIFYVPSPYEGWGLPAMEAMSHGCAVLGSDSGVIKEVGRDNENCIKIQYPKDANYVESVITKLIDSPNLAWTIGENARLDVMDKFLFSKSSRQFEEAIADLLK